MEINVEAGPGVSSSDDSLGTTDVAGCAALVRAGDAGHDTRQTVLLEQAPDESELFSEGESGGASDARDSMRVMPTNATARTVTRADCKNVSFIIPP
jgi:hypothetical protein